ncbi:hypothetical protein V1226_17385 [Lachnospiraceae bacterium JLR.KK009]|nr:hypothetical protein C810_03171 [Lachnospiraceae bacterium A2]MCI8706506.1 hypothetical protein [Lachnospiraceae bacterium]MCI8881617.1 hypothetical protein [Lachnospiraceae bacterium]
MKKTRQYFTAFLLAAVFITVAAYPQNVYAKWVVPKEASFEPTVFGRITTQTDKVRVYVYGGTALKVTAGGTVIFQKTYQREGKKTVRLPLQKAHTKLKFTLTTKYGITGYAVVKTVKDDGAVSKKKLSPSLKKPRVDGEVTDKSTSVRVYAKKGDTLYIKNGAKLIKKAKYKKSGYQNFSIPRQKAETKLTFYTADKTGRSAYVVKEVKDVTPPKKPEVAFTFEDDGTWIDVKGEVGCDIYIRHNSKKGTGRWKYMGTLKGMDLGFHVDDLPNITWIDAGDTFSIRLVDDAGNKSKIATTEAVKEDWHPMSGNNSAR